MRGLSVCALLTCILLLCGCDKCGAAAGPARVTPLAVLQAGEYPLWFALAADGPELIETVFDAEFSAAFMPWPLARHVRFSLMRGKELLMAVNRDGFLCFSPWSDEAAEHEGIGMYRFSGGEFWQRYTVGGFVLFDEKPAALLYRDDRFVDSKEPLPSPRLWTFDFFSNAPQALAAPALDEFRPEDGWDIDTLRRGISSGWFFRAIGKYSERPMIKRIRADNLGSPGKEIATGVFQSTALPEHAAGAPEPLKGMLTVLFADDDCEAVSVVSPAFQNARVFALSRESPALPGFYSGASESSGAFLVVTHPHGEALYVKDGAATVRRFSLPALPQGFAYTGVAVVENTLVASWEEQEGYSIGAAGFMVIALDEGHE